MRALGPHAPGALLNLDHVSLMLQGIRVPHGGALELQRAVKCYRGAQQVQWCTSVSAL